ncbi:hypothetical protein [Paraburkholderia heleia]|uniref:hypothetical protein n=1 Tax=Paraburkholderia heleia TaxID=634127 RepID=UPI0031DFBA34
MPRKKLRSSQLFIVFPVIFYNERTTHIGDADRLVGDRDQRFREMGAAIITQKSPHLRFVPGEGKASGRVAASRSQF